VEVALPNCRVLMVKVPKTQLLKAIKGCRPDALHSVADVFGACVVGA
jgi:hypothetical protein